MVTCSQCEGIERLFSRRLAEQEMRRFRRRGPNATTRLLIAELEAAGIADASLLDVGGGIGALHHVLLDRGAREAVHVDVSPAYLAVARDEAVRRDHAERVRFEHGDFVGIAADLPDADVVTLDRVICCYPEMEVLVARSAEKSRRIVGAVYPRETWWVRAAIVVTNGLMRIRRTTFRIYLHSPAAIDAVLGTHGFDRRLVHRTLVWELGVWVRRRAT